MREAQETNLPGGAIRTRRKLVMPRTPTQGTYIEAIRKHELVFGIGPAGTGKTYLAVACAAEALMNGEVDRIVLSRPAVEAGESLGYLPGDLQAKINPYLRPLLDALVQVESSGRDDAVGDNGNALGSLQIWRVYWSDALEHEPAIGGAYEDVRTRVYAERVVVAYWLRYAAAAVRDGDMQRLARVHNGGPRGHRKQATFAYWQRVSRAMEARHAAR